MNNLRILLLVLFANCIGSLYADKLTVMHYNLMYYDKEEYECTSITNNVDSKDGYLKTIIGHVNPDVFTVNELNASIASAERIKTNVLNINGETKYKRANTSGSFLSNMIYYNSEKVVLKSQTTISTSPRITDVYKLFLKTESLISGDTIFLTCFVTHLKAGSDAASESQRTTAANTIMSYISNSKITGNVLLMGDMNLYSGFEGAFVAYTTPIGSNQFRFFDPINMVGAWNNNSFYKNIHTQSTRTTSNGCFSTGGMDDRFDLVLASSSVLNNTLGIKYHSYKAVAQDGTRFNQSLISPDNKTVPAEVLNALYNMSDHLPVEMKLVYNNNYTYVGRTDYSSQIQYNNPAPEKLTIRMNSETESISMVNIYSVIGQRIYSGKYSDFSKQVEISTVDFNSRVLIVDVLLTSGYRKTFKVIK